MNHTQKIRRLSRFLKYSCIFGMIMAPTLNAYYWIHDGFRIFYFEKTKWLLQFADAPFTSIDELSSELKLAGFLTDLIPCTFFVISLYIMLKLFKRFERLEFFTKTTVRYIRQTGFVLVIKLLIHPFYIALHSFILSLPNPPGQRVVVLAYGPNEIKMLFLAFIVFLAAYIMEEGRHLYEENSMTI
jgi:hypothetical protein